MQGIAKTTGFVQENREHMNDLRGDLTNLDINSRLTKNVLLNSARFEVELGSISGMRQETSVRFYKNSVLVAFIF